VGLVIDPGEQRDRLAADLNGRACWVLVSDAPDGRQRLAALTILLAYYGLREAEVHFGGVRFALRPSGQSGRLFWLTIPKARVGRERLARLLELVGVVVGKSRRGNDLIVLEGRTSANVVLSIVDQVRQGTVGLIVPGNN
jgi:hypothetical protein